MSLRRAGINLRPQRQPPGRRRPAHHQQAGRRVSEHPQLALGLVLDTPGKRTGPNAVHALARLTPFGFPTGLLAADRTCTDRTTAHFAQPARQLGHQPVLDYKQGQRGVQGTHHGALLVDGSLACPAMPTALATTGLDDKAVRDLDDNTPLSQLITAREPYFLKIKQSADARGAIRLQCPRRRTSPSVTCSRFNQVHHITTPRPAVVDLTSQRATAAHTAAKPTVPLPGGEQLPPICQKPSITVRPGDLGKLDKYRQDRHYLHPAWQDACRPGRANIEGLNGRIRSHHIDVADPKKRLAHGRVAQTTLLALMICSITLHTLSTWENTTPRTTTPISEPDETSELMELGEPPLVAPEFPRPPETHPSRTPDAEQGRPSHAQRRHQHASRTREPPPTPAATLQKGRLTADPNSDTASSRP
ncbi:hypothetical protein ACFYQ5_23560 [Streptomyces sp. NPDC005794]|uniref:hypothetical protein n=1 Tax=Streptomyces sp. NPDC005794 TaxID=3364733 RepID=UPI0036BA5DEB